MAVSVPLRGVGCFQFPACFGSRIWCFRPLAGCGLFRYEFETGRTDRGFPSPYGVWVVSTGRALRPRWQTFPPPYGVWVVSQNRRNIGREKCFRPLTGCGLFQDVLLKLLNASRFRPLAGCGLFPRHQKEFRRQFEFPSPYGVWVVLNISREETGNPRRAVSVPLRGVGCFLESIYRRFKNAGFRPLAGSGLFP